MLQLNIIYTKPNFQRPDGERILDLTQSSIVYATFPNVVDMVTVTRNFRMRSDLISQSVYGNQNNLDYILKFNGISNPYSIDEGDNIYIPDLDDMTDALVNPERDQESKDIQELPKKRSDSDKKQAREKRTDILKKKQNNETPKTLPPNIATKPNITFEGGKIVFGQNITDANAAKCPENTSVAKVKEKLLNGKIYG